MAEKNHGPMRGNARGPRPNVANPGKLTAAPALLYF